MVEFGIEPGAPAHPASGPEADRPYVRRLNMRKRRASRPAGSSILASIFLATSCAQTGGGELAPAPLHGVIGAYSRNEIVCVPTAVGNILGLSVGWALTVAALPLTLPLILVADKRDWSTRARGDDSALAKAGIGVLLFPAFFLGGVVGTPFLPFSYLAEESPCNLVGWDG
jgi:hypothetical protein